MNTKLKAYFPMIRTREEILRDIQQNINLTERFYSWKEAERGISGFLYGSEGGENAV